MQALRGVLHHWIDLEEDWASVPPITRPVPNRRATQRDLSLQPPCQLKRKDKLFVFNNRIRIATVHLLDTRKLASHRVNLVDTVVPMG